MSAPAKTCLCNSCGARKPLTEMRHRTDRSGRYTQPCQKCYNESRRTGKRPYTRRKVRSTKATPVAQRVEAVPSYTLSSDRDPRALYRAAMADPARQARFAAKRAEVAEALRRAAEREEQETEGWRAQQRRTGPRRGNRKPIAVGRELYGGAS